MPEYYEHHWQGSPAAVASALDAVGWRADPTADNPQQLLAPVVWVPSVRRAELGGGPVWFALVVATEEMETPAGLSVTPEWLRLPAVGGIAALDPVPSSVTKRQFFRQLRDDGVISQAEAVAAAGRGEIPQTLATRMGEAPAALVADIELDLASMQVVERGSQTWQVVAGLLGWDDTVQDSFFTRAARL